MKGVIFIALNDMIESQYGIGTWEDILQSVNPPSAGIYTSSCDYGDAELTALLSDIAQRLQLGEFEVLKLFGRYLFAELNRNYPIFTHLQPDLFAFLSSIDSVIHKAIQKHYDTPSLPFLSCHKQNENMMTIHYRSPRRMCALAEGLVMGAAEYYRIDVEVQQTVCVHENADHCEIVVRSDA